MASLAVSASVVQAEAGKTHTSNGSSGDSSSSSSSSSSSCSSSNGVTTTTNGVAAAVGTMRRPAPKVGAYQAAAAAAASNRSAALLYPLPQPYDTGLLAVDAAVGHILYYEQCGNPRGAPVLYIHGGPGSGSGVAARCFFDPSYYRIVVFDQRGAARSSPPGCLEANNSLQLAKDIQRLRKHLGIDVWHMLFGGSWGSFLALAYACYEPARVTSMVLRGIFLGSATEIRWLYEDGGASELFPDAWERYVSVVPPGERGDMLEAYYARLTSQDSAVREQAAAAFIGWETAICRVHASAEHVRKIVTTDIAATVSFARIECHYMIHGCWLRKDLLQACSRLLGGVHTTIIHGRQDVVCRPSAAWTLHKALPGSSMTFVAGAGHSAAEPALVEHLVAATDALKRLPVRPKPTGTLPASTELLHELFHSSDKAARAQRVAEVAALAVPAVTALPLAANGDAAVRVSADADIAMEGAENGDGSAVGAGGGAGASTQSS